MNVHPPRLFYLFNGLLTDDHEFIAEEIANYLEDNTDTIENAINTKFNDYINLPHYLGEKVPDESKNLPPYEILRKHFPFTAIEQRKEEWQNLREYWALEVADLTETISGEIIETPESYKPLRVHDKYVHAFFITKAIHIGCE